MPEAYIVDAVRTPVGRRGGGLAGVHPADLGAHVIRALVERNDLDPLAVDDVFFGCVDTHRPAGGRHRPHLLAGRRAARGDPGYDDRPPVRLVASRRCTSPRRRS